MKAYNIICGTIFSEATHKKELKKMFQHFIFLFSRLSVRSSAHVVNALTCQLMLRKSAVLEKWLEGVSGAINSAQQVRKA